MDDRQKINKLLVSIKALKQEVKRLKQIRLPLYDCLMSQGEKLCSDMIETQRELICRFLPNGKLTFVNKACSKYFKRSKDQLIGTNFFDLIPQEAHQRAKDHLSVITPEDPAIEFSHPVITPDGVQRWQLWSACGLFSEQGKRIGFQSVGRDITKLKILADLLLQREAKRQALIQDVLNDTDVGLCILDHNLQCVWVNKAVQRFFGHDWKDIVGQNKIAIIKEKFAPLVKNPKGFEQTLIDAYTKSAFLYGFQFRIVGSKKVSGRWIELRSKSVKSGYYAGGRIEQYTDITHRKLSELALRESEEHFRQLADLLPEAVFETDMSGTITYANRVAYEYFGYNTADLEIGYKVADMIHPDDRHRLKSHIGKLLGGEKIGIHEYMALRKDGTTFPFCTRSTALKKDGTFAGLRGIVIDISEHKQKSTQLEFLRTAIEQVSDAIEITDSEGNMQYVNPAMEKVTGYTRDELIGKNLKIFKSGKHAPATYENIWKTISSGKKWRGQLINRKKDGSLYNEDISITPVFNSNGEITNYVSVKRDISEENRKREKMRHFQKMEALATMAGGIAHDFNNILAGVMGYNELSLDLVPQDSDVYRNLTKAIKGCNRAKKLIDQILSFCRTDETECKPHKIHNVIEDALSLVRSTLPTTIEIKKNILSMDLVAIGPTQMHQVVVNICTNAFQAMEETGGQLGISLTRVELTLDDTLSLHNLNPGPHAKLSISDTGHGMDRETVRKIFDPYFTTKEKDKGTGLGLSVVHGIVNNCKGAINVYSELDVGTTFNVYFPVVDQKDVTDAEIPSETTQTTGAGERILFVDDEKAIVDISKQILEGMGYQVTARTNPMEALEAFRADPYGFDLVISDMTMPNLTGDRLAQLLKSIRADIPIIVCTGFSTLMNEEKAAALGIAEILIKPVSIDNYAGAVRKALE